MTEPIWPNRLFVKTADLRIVSDSLGFPDIVRLNSERFVHLAAALATFKQFDDQKQERHPDQEQLCFLERFPDAADQPTSLANALLINPVFGNRTLSDKTGCWI